MIGISETNLNSDFTDLKKLHSLVKFRSYVPIRSLGVFPNIDGKEARACLMESEI